MGRMINVETAGLKVKEFIPTTKYEISDDLQGFFNFAEFGEYIAEEKEGEFVPDGFMFYDGVGGMDDLRSQLESEESMTMGGM